MANKRNHPTQSAYTDEAETDQNGVISIPMSDSLPSPTPHTDDPLVNPNNLASDDVLAERAWHHWTRQHERYRTQEQRAAWIGNQETKVGFLDFADRAWRVAARRDTGSDQHQNTLSDVANGVYYDAVRTGTATLNTIFFGLSPEDLPYEYEPEVTTDEYQPEVGRAISDHQNALAEFTWDEDGRRTKVKESLMFAEKNANEVVCMEWVQEWQERLERVPTGIGDNGKPTGFKRTKKRRLVKNWPTFKRIDLKDCYYDSLIDGFDKQQLFGWREQWSYDALLGEHAAGRIANLDKVGADQLYYEDSDEMDTRQTNAGESATQGQNGLFEIWQVKGWLPIKEKARAGKKSGKGEWKGGNKLGYYWMTFAGRPGEKGICLRLMLDPYWQIMGASNCNLYHSEKDDKGAWHDGNPTRLQSIYWQIVTNENQGCDNITKAVNAPHWTNGRVMKRNLVYRQNDLVKVSAGATYEPVSVPDLTQAVGRNRDYFVREAQKIAGVDKPLTAEALGSRTSATEAKNIFDTAMMPMDEKASYYADQLFPWMANWDAQMWRTWGSAKITIPITYKDEPFDVRPAELWGPIKVKVTAVSRFHNTTVGRQEINSLIQGTWSMAEKYTTPNGARQFFRQAYKMAGVKHVEQIFPMDGDMDAEENAERALREILSGGWIEPKPTHNHRVWSRVFDDAIRQYSMTGEADDMILRALKIHKEQHDEYVRREESKMAQPGGAGGPGGGEQQPQVPQQEGLPGEIAANPMEAQAGAIANV